MSVDNGWVHLPMRRPNIAAREAAEARQRVLTKPPGALGHLEALAVQLAALQGTATPRAEHVHIAVFAADHGVAAENVSAYPQAVTGQMVRNIRNGGAAISVLARALGATLEVIDVGTIDGAASAREARTWLGPGTANFSIEPAMTEAQLLEALHIGDKAARRAGTKGADIFIGGDMGIGNTTAATALACALLQVRPEQMVGPGTGLDAAGLARKTVVVQRALERHATALTSPLMALRCLGGFEIAALAGSYIGCAQIGLPALVDGFIATSAALVATRLNTNVGDWLLYSHASAESGHRTMLTALGAQPLLDLGMRLGEGSGAAAALPLLRLACTLHNDMATFAEAGVSQQLRNR